MINGLIFDTEKLFLKYWIQSAQEFGFHMQRKHALTIRSLSAALAKPYLKRELGNDFDYNAVRNRRRKHMSKHIATNGLELKQGVHQLLDYCSANNYLTAVATATQTELAVTYLKQAGIAASFSKILGGNAILNGKPAPDIYKNAALALQLPPSDCIALEDSPNGILSAFAAGCKPIMIPDLTEPDELLKPFLYQQVSSLREVIPILANA